MNDRALAVRAQTTLDVDSDESKARALQILEQARAGSPMFPKDLTPSQAGTLARITLRYGLDPLLNELTIYQGRPYLTIDGRERIANEHPAFNGMEIRPATDDERKGFRCAEDEHLWVCTVWRKDRQFPQVGYGRAGGRGDRNPVSRDFPQEMAQKRAKHRALRDAFSIPIPGHEEMTDYRPQLLPEMGEVIDGEVVTIDNPSTNQQKAMIHASIKQLGWTDDEYREVLHATFGVQSSMELAEGQAAAITEMLVGLAEQAKDTEWRDKFHAELKSKGMNIADLWGPEEIPDIMQPVIDAEPVNVIDLQPADGSSLFDATPCTDDQIKALKRLAPKDTKDMDWATYSYEDAAQWLMSIQGNEPSEP